MRKGLSVLIVLVVFLFKNSRAQHSMETRYFKNDTMYFDIEGVAKNVPLVRWSQEPYLLNDSVVCDLTYKKLIGKLIVTAYPKEAYYGKGFAPPVSLMKFKISGVRLDTAKTIYMNNGRFDRRVTKYYSTKLKSRIDYFKYKSK